MTFRTIHHGVRLDPICGLSFLQLAILVFVPQAIRARVMKKMEEQLAFASQVYLEHGRCFAPTRGPTEAAVAEDGEPSLAATLAAAERARHD